MAEWEKMRPNERKIRHKRKNLSSTGWKIKITREEHNSYGRTNMSRWVNGYVSETNIKPTER